MSRLCEAKYDLPGHRELDVWEKLYIQLTGI